MGREAQKRRRKERRQRTNPGAPPKSGTIPADAADAGTSRGAAKTATARRPAAAITATTKSAGTETAKARSPRSGGPDGPPPPPWGAFPLSELITLLGLILFVAAFFVEPPRGPVMGTVGLLLGAVAGLELAAREHLAGFRSHTLVLAGAPAVGIVAVLFLIGPDSLDPPYKLAIGALVGVVMAFAMVRLFSRRSGGSRIKFGGFRGG